ncbi:MAG: mechanosensitive ion channel [Alistipes sp.]|nr:mechanosensitive ion channel [Alistipes sp.]
MENETTTAPAVVETIQEKVEQASGFFSGIADYFKAALPLIVIAVIVLIVGIVLTKLITRFISAVMKRSTVDNAARKFIVSVIRTILYLIVVIIALSIINVPMTSVITIIGAAGLAASLALQNCLTNLCGGFVILFSKPFAAGDTVELDGTVGIVREIGILNTKLHTFDGKTVLIPNGNVTAAKLINYTDTPTRRVDLNIDISYTSDFSAARQLILSAVCENPMILQKPAPVVRMSSHKESSVGIDVLVWTENDNYKEVSYTLNETIKQLFDKSGIEIPYKQLDVHISE